MFKYLGYLGLLAATLPLLQLYLMGHKLSYALPNALLFTPYRNLTRQLWHELVEIDTRVIIPPQPIPEIRAEDYSFDALKKATDNFRHPAVVRGLFKDAPAIKKWVDPEYLPSKLGKFTVPVVMNATYGVKQDERSSMSFAEAFTDIVKNKSKRYLFFPVQSREHFDATEFSTDSLADAVNDVVKTDLELDPRLWPTFGSDRHKTFHGTQLIVGYGSATPNTTTGTGWHCAAGNNYFIQVAGRKRWYFLHPEETPYVYPLRGGIVNMMTGNANMLKYHDHIPLKFVDLDAGDMLYNPDWEWHTIQNYEGLSIGCPIREFNSTLSLRNNLHFTGIVMLNKFMKEKLGIYPGGF